MFNVEFFKELCRLIPIGICLVNSEKKILFWNQWLEFKTGFSESHVLNHTFADLYQDFNNPRFDWALEQVTTYGNPQILSQILNNHLIPIPLQRKITDKIEFMPQHVDMIPITYENTYVAMVAISDVTELVLQKSTLFEKAFQLEDDSFHDALTSTYNRRFLWKWFEKESQIAKSESYPMACCLFDLDYFKKINDQHGHQVGDQVLKEFVFIVDSQLRSTDIFVRYGGEEFLALLPNCTLEQAQTISEKIRKLLEETSIGGLPAGEVTCSIGISVLAPDSTMEAKALIELADTELYRAKSSGRNKVMPDH